MIFFVLLVNYTFKCNAYYVISTMPFVLFRAKHFMSLRAEKRGPQKILSYFWGKGVCKHKTGDCRLRRLTGQKRSIRRVAISRKGYLIIKPTQDTCIMGPDGILCTRGEKEYASVRQTFVACDDCLVKNEAYDAEKKAQTSIRVSIIACDNAISKSR